MNALLDGYYYTENRTEIDRLTRQKYLLNVGTVIVTTLSIGDAFLYVVYNNYHEYHDINKLTIYWTFSYLSYGIQLTCLILWGVALCRIERKTRQIDKLMPKKCMFIVHGTLLTVYFVFHLAVRLITEFA